MKQGGNLEELNQNTNKMKAEETRNLIRLYLDEKAELLKSFPIDKIVAATEIVWNAYLNDGRIFACGMGGNASYVGNMVCDFANHPFVSDDKSKPMSYGVKRLTAFDLTASVTDVTGLLNDLGKEYIFSQQLANHKIGENDVVFGFTGSGSTSSVLEAFKVAKQHLAKTIAITRSTGKCAGDLEGKCDMCINLPVSSTFPGQVGGNEGNFHYEDYISMITHMITGVLRQRVHELYDNGNKI
jgi:D-sedoheptulose 7-phosphate isomerase